jgi:integrase
MSRREISTGQVPAPTAAKWKVPTRTRSTKPRKHLEPAEVAAMLKAAKRSGHYRLRDEAAILLACRHAYGRRSW